MFNNMKRPVGMGAVMLIACTLACEQRDGRGLHAVSTADRGSSLLFAEDFESGTLANWSDGVDRARFDVVTDAAAAQSGSRYLAVTYPAGSDGGWLTKFLMPGYEELYVSYHVRFPRTWVGGTKLVAIHGSRQDDRWSPFGKAGVCPTGGDFLTAMLVVEPPGAMRFYTYYPAMAREPDGVTCWGRFGDGQETYQPPLSVSPDGWHQIELLVSLNAPGHSNARQTFWVDGVERGTWSGFSFRDSPALRLNSVQLTFSVSGGVPLTQQLYVDNLVVRSERPAVTARR
jgi:hypothetical protein